MSYSPKIREELIGRLYRYKQSLKHKKPITRLVNEAVEEYLGRRTKEDTKENTFDEKLNEKEK